MVSGDKETAYKAKRGTSQRSGSSGSADRRETVGGVRVDEVFEDNKVVPVAYQPDNPLADDEGFVYPSNVDSMMEMDEITQASRSFETLRL